MKLLEIPEDAFEKAAQKYDKTSKSAEEDVELLVRWVKSQPHLPEIMEKVMIRNFLISNKFSIERTKQKIDFYYTIKSKIPDIYEVTNPKRQNMKEIIELLYFMPLPKISPENYRIFIVSSGSKPFDHVSALCLANNVQEVRLKEDCMLGDIVIEDFKNVHMDFILRLTPTFVAKMVACYEKVFSMPVKALYIINSPSFVSHLLNLMKGFLKPKIFDRVQVHKDDSILLKVFPKEIIPKDYGGEEKSMEELKELWKLKFEEYGDRFDQLDLLKVDEKLRPEELVNSEVLGFHGNFKKLDVD